MRWPWQRRDSAAPAPSGASADPRPATEASVSDPPPVGRSSSSPSSSSQSPSGWAFHPPLQRTISADLAIHRDTATGWTATGRNPLFTGTMTHLVSGTSLSGVVDGDGGGLGPGTAPHVPAPLVTPTSPTATGWTGPRGAPEQAPVAQRFTRADAAPGLPVLRYAVDTTAMPLAPHHEPPTPRAVTDTATTQRAIADDVPPVPPAEDPTSAAPAAPVGHGPALGATTENGAAENGAAGKGPAADGSSSSEVGPAVGDAPVAHGWVNPAVTPDVAPSGEDAVPDAGAATVVEIPLPAGHRVEAPVPPPVQRSSAGGRRLGLGAPLPSGTAPELVVRRTPPTAAPHIDGPTPTPTLPVSAAGAPPGGAGGSTGAPALRGTPTAGPEGSGTPGGTPAHPGTPTGEPSGTGTPAGHTVSRSLATPAGPGVPLRGDHGAGGGVVERHSVDDADDLPVPKVAVQADFNAATGHPVATEPGGTAEDRVSTERPAGTGDIAILAPDAASDGQHDTTHPGPAAVQRAVAMPLPPTAAATSGAGEPLEGGDAHSATGPKPVVAEPAASVEAPAAAPSSAAGPAPVEQPAVVTGPGSAAGAVSQTSDSGPTDRADTTVPAGTPGGPATTGPGIVIARSAADESPAQGAPARTGSAARRTSDGGRPGSSDGPAGDAPRVQRSLLGEASALTGAVPPGTPVGSGPAGHPAGSRATSSGADLPLRRTPGLEDGPAGSVPTGAAAAVGSRAPDLDRSPAPVQRATDTSGADGGATTTESSADSRPAAATASSAGTGRPMATTEPAHPAPAAPSADGLASEGGGPAPATEQVVAPGGGPLGVLDQHVQRLATDGPGHWTDAHTLLAVAAPAAPDHTESAAAPELLESSADRTPTADPTPTGESGVVQRADAAPPDGSAGLLGLMDPGHSPSLGASAEPPGTAPDLDLTDRTALPTGTVRSTGSALPSGSALPTGTGTASRSSTAPSPTLPAVGVPASHGARAGRPGASPTVSRVPDPHAPGGSALPRAGASPVRPLPWRTVTRPATSRTTVPAGRAASSRSATAAGPATSSRPAVPVGTSVPTQRAASTHGTVSAPATAPTAVGTLALRRHSVVPMLEAAAPPIDATAASDLAPATAEALPSVQRAFTIGDVSTRALRRRLAGTHRRHPPATSDPAAEDATTPPSDPSSDDPASGDQGGHVHIDDVTTDVVPTPGSATSEGAEGTGMDAKQLAALADVLYPRLLRQLRHEVLLDRERRGVRTDRRMP